MGKKLENKTVLITGASRGIGFATAELFAAEGANVIITGRDTAGLEEARKKLPDNVLALQSDTASMQDIKALFKIIKDKYAKLDVVILNAGIVEDASIEDVTEDSFDRQMNVNLKGAYFTAQASVPLLPLHDNASIIFISSGAGSVGIENLSVYSATKAALISLTKSIAADLVKQGIRVNAISPGYTQTSMGLKRNQDVYDKVCAIIPLGNRFATPEEMAKTALFLACDATYMTGQNLDVDGGLCLVPAMTKS